MPDQKIVSEGLLITDINPSYAGKDVVTHALNNVMVTHQGDNSFRGNEPSNTFCFKAPYKQIGQEPIKNNRMVIFSTDNVNSEIGIGDYNTCTYTKVVSSECLNFNTDVPVSAMFKENDKGQEIVTFIDANNSIRRLNLQDIPYTYTFEDDACETKIYTNQLNCDEILQFRKIALPEITINEGYGGTLENGMYAVVIGYNIGNQRYGDYYGLTLPIPIFTGEDNQSGSLDVELKGLDREFDSFNLIVVRNINGVTEARMAGTFPTSQSKIRVTTLNRDENTIIPTSNLVIANKVWDRAGFISGNSEYLILADLVSKARINIQKQVRDIKIEYVIQQYPLDYYYNKGNDVGYFRDEVYSFFIRYFYTTGDFTEHAHIFGRVAEKSEKGLASGEDVYEVLEPEFKGRIERWQKENTASTPILINNPFVNNTREYGFGKMAYYESEVLYPDNQQLFGEDACTPMRFPKMPDEAKVPRWSDVDGKQFINVLGVRFKNIPYPLDADGKPVRGIAGYEILRGDRYQGGNRSVIARGILTNARGYVDTQNQSTNVIYANYPVNDLRPDSFLSSTQSEYRNGRERKVSPLTTVYNDKFNFYTPHAYFGNKYRMGEEFVMESYETGPVKGYFEQVYKHPKDKLITNFSLYFSLLLGAIQGLLMTLPRVDKSTEFEYKVSVPPAATYRETAISHDFIGNSPIFTLNLAASGQYNVTQIAKKVLQIIAKVGMFIYFAADYASNALQIIKNFSKSENYAYQYNSVVQFNQQIPVVKGSKIRKAISTPEYLSPNNHTINGNIVNNKGRAENIFVELNKEVVPPQGDNSRITLKEANTSPQSQITTTGSVIYATSKIKNPSQYGTLDSVRPIKTHNTPFPLTLSLDQFGVPAVTDSPTIFGGDCSISEMSVLNKFPFFTQDATNQNIPDNTLQFDYRMYRSVGYPRFWVDFSDYEIGNLITRSPNQGALPANKFNMDGKPEKKNNTAWTVDGKYFYLYSNCVLKFIVEADYHIAFREETDVPHYSKKNSSLSQIFRSDNMPKQEKFKLNPAFTKLQSNEFYSQHLPLDFDQMLEANVRSRDRNGLIYSLPSFENSTVDNWLYFLPGNYTSFSNTDFGNLTGVHQVDQDKIIFLFDKASPYISLGRDQLQTDGGRKITIGDGGLFAQQPRELIHTDNAYGASQSKFAFTSTQFGAFYPSATQGRIFNFTNGLDDLSRQGMSQWCKEFMPIKLVEYYPEYDLPDNPASGVGYISGFDSSLEIYYLTKRDVIPQPNMVDSLTYDKARGKFVSRGKDISLTDTNYFKDISFTLSYSPARKGFISFHSWIPDRYIQTQTHFMTVKGDGVWKHNEATDSFCNFYGKDHSFQIEYPINTGDEVVILSSLELIFEAFKYKNKGRDRFNVYDEFYSNAVVWNDEQVSGMLALNKRPNDPTRALEYGGFNPTKNAYDIIYSKVENRNRINQFFDITADRGKYSPFSEYPIWFNSENGWERMLNPKAINYNKPADQRKKFRHYLHRVWLAKDVSGSTKFITKFLSANIKQSPR